MKTNPKEPSSWGPGTTTPIPIWSRGVPPVPREETGDRCFFRKILPSRWTLTESRWGGIRWRKTRSRPWSRSRGTRDGIRHKYVLPTQDILRIYPYICTSWISISTRMSKINFKKVESLLVPTWSFESDTSKNEEEWRKWEFFYAWIKVGNIKKIIIPARLESDKLVVPFPKFLQKQ